uniref:ABC transporter substrate-binding protein n=1 Tax=Gorillibacterium massiliense TaxID=1280390 RepID=UPI000592D7BC
VLSGSYAGHALFLGAPVIAVDSFTYDNPLMKDYLKDVKKVSADNLEQIIELDPDLIITDDYATNLKQLGEIAPTLGLTYSSQTYLTRVVELGKILNKQKEAEAWVADFEARAKKAGEEIKAKLGDISVTVIESWEKDLYVFGDNYARGTEIMYDAMGLKKTDKVKELVSKEGYSAISPEVLPQLGGDFIVFSKSSNADNSFLDTESYKNIDAVKKNHVLTADAAQFYFNDPITLEYQLKFITDGMLGK